MYQIGFDPVDDEDFLVISEETSTEMPVDLPREDLDEEDDESIPYEPKEAPFNLPLEHILEVDTIAPPNEYDSTNDQPLERSSESIVKANDEPHIKDFMSLIDNIANSASDDLRSGKTFSAAKSDQDTPIVEDIPVLPSIPEPEPQMTMPEPQSAIGQVIPVMQAKDEVPESTEAIVPQYDNSETNVDFDLQRHDDNLENTSTDSESQVSEVNVPEYETENFVDHEGIIGRSIDTTVPVTPVYDFWHSENEDHTFHMGKLFDTFA